MFLIVGLGNPGEEYCYQRHNIGFRIIDEAHAQHGYPSFSFKFRGMLSEKNKIFLLKPMTYMNLSGDSVRAVMQFFKIPLENLCVIHDDLDLAFLRTKIKKGGSDAGHRGLVSITKALGPDYWRLRIGIDRPQDRAQVSSYVLSNFSRHEEQALSPFIRETADNLLNFFQSQK